MGWGRNRRTSTFSSISLHAHDQYSSLHHSTAFTTYLFTVRLLLHFCPIICADHRCSVLEPFVPAFLPPATPPEVHWRTRQIVGGLSSKGDTYRTSACSVSTYAGHHLLRPLLTTVLVVKKQNIKPHNPFRYDMSG